MREIPLTQGQFALVDDEDYNDLMKYTWCAFKGKNTYYAYNRVNRIFMHCLLLPIAPNSKNQRDHIDGNGLNNQKHNIRVCTVAENHCNARKRKGTTSQYKGVSFDSVTKTWKSYININGVSKHLGRYPTEKLAAIQYDIAALTHFGAFAKLNFMGVGDNNVHMR